MAENHDKPAATPLKVRVLPLNSRAARMSAARAEALYRHDKLKGWLEHMRNYRDIMGALNPGRTVNLDSIDELVDVARDYDQGRAGAAWLRRPNRTLSR